MRTSNLFGFLAAAGPPLPWLLVFLALVALPLLILLLALLALESRRSPSCTVVGVMEMDLDL